MIPSFSYQVLHGRDDEKQDGDLEMGGRRQTSAYVVTNSHPSLHHRRNVDGNGDSSLELGPRLIDRRHGKVFVKKRIQFDHWWALYRLDWFHSLVDAPTIRIILILMALYVFVVTLFAIVYHSIRQTWYCELQFESFRGAFAFSLEVMATFGFSTVIDACTITTTVVTIQSCVRLIVESFTIGVLYCRFARPHSRASTVIFSDKAIIRRIRGKLYFMFQLCELRKHQLVDAHVRLYAIKRETSMEEIGAVTADLSSNNRSGGRIQTCSMRLNHPNDELGSMLLLMMPQVVVHELDLSSPLVPPPVWVTNHVPPAAQHPSVNTRLTTPEARLTVQRRVVRWNPPVYRSLLRPRPSSTTHPVPHTAPHHDAEYEYDVQSLSNLEFPNVSRRGSDVDRSVRHHSPHDAEGLRPGGDRGQETHPEVERHRSPLSSTRPQPLSVPPRPVSMTTSLSPEELLSPGLEQYSEALRGVRRSVQPQTQSSSSHNRTPAETNKQSRVRHSSGEEEGGGDWGIASAVLDDEESGQYGSLAPSMPSTTSQEPAWQVQEREMIQRYLQDRQIEIIAIVEGVDSATGGNVQARHSYVLNEIVWNKTFAYCLFDDPDDGLTTVDFDLFHELEEAPVDAAYPGPLSSSV